jgi:hypothetical protein
MSNGLVDGDMSAGGSNNARFDAEHRLGISKGVAHNLRPNATRIT